ncbi:MAG TPA: hypothetical protein VMR06_08100 [Dokdonella sp.]|uniref:hypothetical protein n=1 Tax=Dokdonella sp. TaxID=2291710 RepID=UPI002CD5DEE7|nr:hypothetical protein [Dokdonella sp.]HUD41945.1 hypothetical protein [Dokdonella sp.]
MVLISCSVTLIGVNLPGWRITADDNFLPEVGFTLVRYCKPERCSDNDEPVVTIFGKKYSSAAVGLGRRLGMSFGNDEEICANLGFGFGLPFNYGN